MIACIGGTLIDRRGVLRAPSVLATSNPANFAVDFGGVARNVAQNLARLGCDVTLVSRVGDDDSGGQILRHIELAGINGLFTVSKTRATASYTAILEPDGELLIGLDDTDLCDEITPDVLAPSMAKLREHSLWFTETNLCAETIAWLLDAAAGIPVAVDAISIDKSRKLPPLLSRIPLLFCNIAQAIEIAGISSGNPNVCDVARAVQAAGARAGVVSAGATGIAVWSDGQVTFLPALKACPRDVTGAGDALISGTLYGLSQGLPLAAAARWGLAAAAITVESEFASAPELSRQLLEARL